MLYPLSYGRVTCAGWPHLEMQARAGTCSRWIDGVSEGIRTLDLQGHNLAP